jgi:type II secretory pathway pseudopilin PulG
VLTGSHVPSSPAPLAHRLESEMIDMHRSDFRRRLTDEIGFILPTAMVALLILTVLIGAAITVAAQTSTSTTRDNNTKAALEAAEAGLQAAAYRLTKLEPAKTACITSTATLTPVSINYCASSEETLGNGAKFEYWDTTELTAGQACTGTAVTVPTGSTLTQRCVTSVGKVNGIQRRVQQRVFTLLSSKLFEVEGILGYHSVTVRNNGTVAGEIGSNEIVNLNPGVTVTKTDLGPTGEIIGTGAPGTITKNPAPFGPRPTIPIGQSATSANTTAECKPPLPGEPATAGKNCDWLITNGINKVTPGDAASAGVTFNSSIRSLAMGNKAELTLKEGIYNFCDFQVTGTFAKLTIENGARVEIFIDSKEREGSGCSGDPEAGKLGFKNGVTIENLTKNATDLQIYVYDASGGTIEFAPLSSSAFYGTIVAPQSKLEIKNNGEFTGAIEANEVELTQNFKFNWAVEDQNLQAEVKPHYARSAWEECPPTYTGTEPQKGC